jgi:hypothetical protein
MFLDDKCEVPHVLYVSFMRSGNTFLRKYLESMTGIVTGSNCPNVFTVNFALAIAGLKGESYTDNKVQFIKSHFPYIYPMTTPVSGSKSVVCVRNPLDVMTSLFLFTATLTHNATPLNKFHTEFAEQWDWVVKEQFKFWTQFCHYWVEHSKKKSFPFHFFRYEDLSATPEPVIKEILEFTMAQDSIDGTYLEKRIKDTLANKDSGVAYKPRAGKINGNLEYFSEENIKLIKNNCREFLILFGYVKVPGQDNTSGFFEYDDLTADEIKQAGSFVALNKEQKAWHKANLADINKKKITVNNPGEGI